MKKLSDKDQVRLYKLHESINTWDLTNKNWGEFNSKDYPFTQEVYAN